MRVAAAHGGAFEELRSDAAAARAFQHGYAELGGALLAFGGQIRQMPDAYQFERVAEHAENDVAGKVEIADVTLDDVILHDLPETQQAVVFVEREEVSQQTLAIRGRKFTNQNRQACGVRTRTIACDDLLGGAVDG